MPDLASYIASLPPRAGVADLLADFVPPPRFHGKDFSDYEPKHPSQAAALARLTEVSAALHPRGGVGERLRTALRKKKGWGIYLDGGFGVGKTHLLTALWNAAATSKSYLTFDELVYLLGMVGVAEARQGFRDRRLIAVDEWELDDPGNLKLALAFLRGALEDGILVAVTSNTLPLELGAGRFSQKDFRAEVEELASAFEVIRVEGEDYRHRHFRTDPGREHFASPADADRFEASAPADALVDRFEPVLTGLAALHPIRYAELVRPLPLVLIRGLRPFANLSDALRWVHFIDNLYDASVPFHATSDHTLGELFPDGLVEGPFGKKLQRCLSRLEEMLGE